MGHIWILAVDSILWPPNLEEYGLWEWPVAESPLLPGAALSLITLCIAQTPPSSDTERKESFPFKNTQACLFSSGLKQEWLEKMTGQGFLESNLACISIND